MTLRPGRNLVGLSVAAVVLSAVAFYLPWSIWLLVPLVIAALGCGIYDARWLRLHRWDLVVSREVPQIAGRDVPFDVTLRCVNRGLAPLRGSFAKSLRHRPSRVWWRADFRRKGSQARPNSASRLRSPRAGSSNSARLGSASPGPCRARRALGGDRQESGEGLSRRAGGQGRSLAAFGGRNSDSRPPVAVEASQRGDRIRVDPGVSRRRRPAAHRLAGNGPNAAVGRSAFPSRAASGRVDA